MIKNTGDEVQEEAMRARGEPAQGARSDSAVRLLTALTMGGTGRAQAKERGGNCSGQKIK